MRCTLHQTEEKKELENWKIEYRNLIRMQYREQRDKNIKKDFIYREE